MKNMARFLFLCLCAAGLAACFDLDVFVYPIVFKPTVKTTFEYGQYTPADLYTEISPLFPDTVVTNTGTVTPVSFDSEGNTLWAYSLAHTVSPNKIILFCHGNVGCLDHFWQRAKLLYVAGYDVFYFDYRGFGKSTGTSTEAGMKTDAEMALKYVTVTLGYAPSQVLLYGYSLGSVAAVHLAAHGAGMDSAIGLILDSPIGSTDIYVQDATGLPIPADYITKFDLDNVTNIKLVHIPLLWMGGTADSTTANATQGQAVYDNCPSKVKYKKIVDGAEHGKAPYEMDHTFALYITAMHNFGYGAIPFP